MNKQNVFFGIIGVAAFVAALWFVWGSGTKKPAQGPNPVPAPSGGEAKKPIEPGKVEPQPQPVPPKPVDPKPVEPVPPVEPGGTAQPKPVPVEPGGKAPEETGTGFEKPRITSDTGSVDESSRAKAAGSQEVPGLWSKGETQVVEDPDAPKPLPKTYKVEKTMSVYRAAEIIYGDTKNWRILFEANKGVLGDPEKVEAGTVLTVPDPEKGGPEPVPSGKKKSGLTDGLF
jgi:nucleoid-associated protein YgaU